MDESWTSGWESYTLDYFRILQDTLGIYFGYLVKNNVFAKQFAWWWAGFPGHHPIDVPKVGVQTRGYLQSRLSNARGLVQGRWWGSLRADVRRCFFRFGLPWHWGDTLQLWPSKGGLRRSERTWGGTSQTPKRSKKWAFWTCWLISTENLAVFLICSISNSNQGKLPDFCSCFMFFHYRMSEDHLRVWTWFCASVKAFRNGFGTNHYTQNGFKLEYFAGCSSHTFSGELRSGKNSSMRTT